jgi:hypothetical protein
VQVKDLTQQLLTTVLLREELQFLRIKRHSPCAYIEGEKEQTMTTWEHMIM